MSSSKADKDPKAQGAEHRNQSGSPFGRTTVPTASGPQQNKPNPQRPRQRYREPTTPTARELMPGIHRTPTPQGQSDIQNILSRAYGITFAPEDEPSNPSGSPTDRSPSALPFRPPRARLRTSSPRSTPLSDSPQSRSPFADSGLAQGSPKSPVSWRRREFIFESGNPNLRTPETRLTAINHTDDLGHTVYGEVDKIYWRPYNGQPACLLVLKIGFLSSASTGGLRRFQNARVQMRFANYKPDAPSKRTIAGVPVPIPAEIPRTDPRIVNFSPARIFGRISVEGPGSRYDRDRDSRTMRPGLKPGAIPPSSTNSTIPSTSDYPPFHPSHNAVRILGNKVGSNIVSFDTTEDPRRAAGISDSFCYGALIVHDGLGRIKCHVSAVIADRRGTPVGTAGGKDEGDDSIMLIPGRTWDRDLFADRLPGTFEEWTDRHWKMAVPNNGERPNIVQGSGI